MHKCTHKFIDQNGKERSCVYQLYGDGEINDQVLALKEHRYLMFDLCPRTYM